MDTYKIQRKIIEYLDQKAGKDITRQEIKKKFTESSEFKRPDPSSKKVKSFKRKEKVPRKEIEYLIDQLCNLLEEEGLLIPNKKYFTVANPFRLTGRISISRRGDGFISLPSKNEIFVPGPLTNTAITGDKVEVIPLGVGKKDRLEAEVTKVLKRGRILYRMKVKEKTNKFVFGNFLDMLGEGKEGVLHVKSILKDSFDAININDVLIVKLKEGAEPQDNLYDVSFIRFESDTKEDADLQRILMKYNYDPVHPDFIPLDFPEEVSEKTVSDWNSRTDLRDLYAVTIDGITAKDFDDAISFVDEGNRLRIWIHIADVSYYVEKGSALDKEAYERATSVYLANRVVPMLPPILSEDLCSLVANTNRLAFTVEMEANKTGEIYNAKFYKSIIKVKQRYTYEMAEEEIKAQDPNNWMYQVSLFTDALRKQRMKTGRIDLNLRETTITWNERKEPIGIENRERLTSHILIEELMLSANLKVDEFLRKKKIPTLHRIHEPMDEEKLETLNHFLQLNGYNVQIHDTSYAEIMKAVKEIQDNSVGKIFNYLLLRSFMQAYYGADPLGHWGLGFKDYCHFTSPIRRYPDLIVHRVLHATLLEGDKEYTDNEIAVMGLHCSEEERRAADAERDIVKIKSFRYLESTGIKEFKGFIVGIRPSQIFVELDISNLEGVLDKSEFTDEFEVVIKNDFSFYSKKYSKIFFIGDPVTVSLDRIDFEEIKVFLKLKDFKKDEPSVKKK
ncbi:ribonuclease R family protein [Leptospira levettii]|uniref:exoribonuclease II n=1 Tax=Leptospira levettii TaxID=2023178 RepID=A0ABY2MQ78_9LEPT|nr:VacB/RNase II family 3'-5' exoribonuclease [Leptospira levettii]PKA27860.1 ribonuclease R [Leptospira sp. mixed culture ATI2-C-A1]TGL72933.1 VacB/RNase II family 3'-5' exoribonuclease [Leptospira levettii]TGM25165.1 VacB/RNase II family 3'-5' exoribonuclease [Leptospira levettii]TGM84442.1 VacB/RNase II family 3'-5' exoribonuclease [Leptospira levettii]